MLKSSGDANVDGLAAWCTDTNHLVVELDDLGYLFDSHLSSAAGSGDETVSILDDPVLGEQAYSRRWFRDRDGSLGNTIFPPVIDELNVQDATGEMVLGVQAIDDGVRNDISRLRGHVIEGVCQTEQRTVKLLGQACLAVAREHHLVDQAQLVVEIDADVPVDAEERVSAYLNADRPPS
ncbi:hypothetical protein PG997_011484 [Apiospora hydei]|uniref:Uncharacterized protein n=1 Tax=Apiospora hydei TaxID=1337664 RepID=A0ABR1VJ67_9PEZI